jgi:peroxiredoxin
MLRTRFHWTILILLVAILGGAWTLVSKETVHDNLVIEGLTTGPQAGFLAPDFTLSTVDDVAISLSDHKGQPVVLNFWATWCPPCRQEMPHLQAASEDFAGKAHFIGVDQGETAPQVAAYADELDLTFTLLVDGDNIVNNEYGIRALPTTIFIDKNGLIVEVFTGVLNQAVLEDRLNRLLE